MDGRTNTSMPLRLQYPHAFQQLVETLRLAGLNSYDIIAEIAGPTQAQDVVVRICYGQNYQQVMESTLCETQLVTPDKEVFDFFEQVAKECQQVNIKDYRAFMGQARP